MDQLPDGTKKKPKRKKVFIFPPERRGTWVYNMEIEEYQCTACGGIGLRSYRFCQNCGAKMMEVEE